MTPIYLIGFMAAGKTTLGRALAQRLGREFIDTDREIEVATGMTVSEIFANAGEDTFRSLEKQLIHDIAAGSGGPVVACGGGTPLRRENMETMLASGTVVWLQTSEAVILRRLALTPGTRPLVDGRSPDELREYVHATVIARTPAYSLAHAVFDSSRLESIEQIRDSVDEFITRFRL